MSGTLRIDRVAATSGRFGAHHGVGGLRAGASLALGEEVGRGGFGTVSAIASVDGRAPSRPLLAKVLDDAPLGQIQGGADRIADNLAALLAKLEGRADEDWCELLLALPFSVGFATVRGRTTLVALMLDLRALGYEASPFAETDKMVGYLARPAVERQVLAASFAAKVALLEEIGLIHGDLNTQNLLISYGDLDVQVIDVDAGVLVVRGDEIPLTPGKPDGFMPPEVKQPSAPGQIDMSAYRAAAERWPVGCIVGYLAFGVHPAFFLEEISAASIGAYALERPGWPEIDPGSPLFTTAPASRNAYPQMLAAFGSLPEEVIATFRRLFAAGLDADRRPGAREWVGALKILRSPPRFVEVRTDGNCLIAGMQVSVEWQAQGTAAVEVQEVLLGGAARSLGTFAGAGSVTVALSRSAGFVLTARNGHGEAHATAGPIRVLPAPAFAKGRPPRPRLGGGPRLPLDFTSARPSYTPVSAPRPALLRPPRPKALR